jgi:acyl carrier protein
MMTLEAFTKNLENELEDIPKGTLTPEVNYKDLETWSSMYALIIIAYVNLEFDVTLNGDDLRNCNNIQELYDLIQSRI